MRASAPWLQISVTRFMSVVGPSCSSAPSAGGFLSCSGRYRWDGWQIAIVERPSSAGQASAFAGMLTVCGLAVNAFMLFWAQLGVGISKSNTISVQWSLLADRYPIGLRGRISATLNFGTQTAGALSPAAHGWDRCASWRDCWLAVGIRGFSRYRWWWSPSSCSRLPEPVRGQHEKSSVLGTVIDDEEPAPISVEAAFARLRRIRTLMAGIAGFAALGFRALHGTGAGESLRATAIPLGHARSWAARNGSPPPALSSFCLPPGSDTTSRVPAGKSPARAVLKSAGIPHPAHRCSHTGDVCHAQLGILHVGRYSSGNFSWPLRSP